MFLVADIGGTKTELAFYDSTTGLGTFTDPIRVASARYPSLEDLLRETLGDRRRSLQGACLAVPGPVRYGRAHLTNLPWEVDQRRLEEVLGVPTWVMNDVEAMAHALPYLSASDFKIVREGQKDPKGAMVIVAVGTGLGEAFLVWGKDGYHAYPSEGGHVGFAPASPLQRELLEYLQLQFEHVSVERVCSGMAIPYLYRFFRAKEAASEDPTPDHLGEQAPDPTAFIVERAIQEPEAYPDCRRAMELFVSILGSEAGDFALKILATGGVYLAGGIPPRILPLLQHETFLRAFEKKGRLSSLLREIPVYVVVRRSVGLLGAAIAACGYVRTRRIGSASVEGQHAGGTLQD
ncbi:glucokinase [Candidatus Methylacidithermus pantelleriae]|uniref:Glucokinase n=1 Tax=Candidatus Methylacidithermus pantelleriae TaxID=2744239 RepID=A0A8J2BQU0_9BACT|nr:glucokinase [Candidatus Methylacidithermus pantelleriae]CAF0702707.1 Glucokinase [Candidatus Methylacidithermus pantelleriae]